MSRAKDALQAAGLVAAIGIALAFGKNVGDYAAPTGAEIENDIQTQRADLCAADGWPDDAAAKKAFAMACHDDLKHNPT